MAARKSVAKKPAPASGKLARLGGLLKTRAPVEDTAAYDAAVLERSIALAEAALARHRRGDSVIAVDNDPAIQRHGRAQTVITVVNDNMPFLFDSILGEIADTAGEPTLVMHPVILVRHDKHGVSEIVGDAASQRTEGDLDRVSVIHVHVTRLPEAACAALEARLTHILAQVRAVGARLEADAVAPRPGDQRLPLPAAFAEQGGRHRGHRLAGMAARQQFHLPRHARVRIHRRRDDRHAAADQQGRPRHPFGPQRAGAAARHRSGHHHAGDPRLPARAGPADRHQGQRQVRGAPAHLSRLCRRQDLRPEGQTGGRTADRRPVHLDGLHQLGDEDPLSALQGARRAGEIRLRAGRPFRQGAHQRAGILSARRAVPDQPADPDEACRSDPGARRAAARARPVPRRPVRPLRLGDRLRAARPLRFGRPRSRSATISRRSSKAGSRPTTRPFPRARWRACTSSSAAPAERPRSLAGDARSRHSRHRPDLGRRAARGGGRTGGRPRADCDRHRVPGGLSQQFQTGHGAARRRIY